MSNQSNLIMAGTEPSGLLLVTKVTETDRDVRFYIASLSLASIENAVKNSRVSVLYSGPEPLKTQKRTLSCDVCGTYEYLFGRHHKQFEPKQIEGADHYIAKDIPFSEFETTIESFMDEYFSERLKGC